MEKLTSYLKDKWLFQAMVVASKRAGLGDEVEARWKNSTFSRNDLQKASPVINERSFTYSRKTSHQDKVLTPTDKMTETVRKREDGDEVGGERQIRTETNICLDVVLFVNGEEEVERPGWGNNCGFRRHQSLRRIEARTTPFPLAS